MIKWCIAHKAGRVVVEGSMVQKIPQLREDNFKLFSVSLGKYQAFFFKTWLAVFKL